MRDMGFLSKAITIYFGKKAGFDYKNNDWWSKSAYFWLVIISDKLILCCQLYIPH